MSDSRSTPLKQRITDILLNEEGVRLVVYDDATGKPIVPGTTVKGHPTIGIGRCLDTEGITLVEAHELLQDDIEGIINTLSAQPWWGGLNDTRRAVLVCMAYQMGVTALLSFKNTLAHVAAGQYAQAADEMLNSVWARQTPARAKRMADMMRHG